MVHAMKMTLTSITCCSCKKALLFILIKSFFLCLSKRCRVIILNDSVRVMVRVNFFPIKYVAIPGWYRSDMT